MTTPCMGPGAPTAPALRPPAGACDSHLHVLGPYARYPLVEQRSYTCPEATLSDLRRYMATMGLARVVIAQPSAAGPHMAVTLDAIAALGDRARGTAILRPTATDRDLERLHAGGIRGLRLSAAFGFSVNAATLRRWAARVAPLGWHVAVWTENAQELRLLRDLAGTLPAPLVVDHLAARSWQPQGSLEQADFRVLGELLGTGNAWLKLSAMCRAVTGPFPWPALVPFARKLVEDFPERLLWASDWPHVGLWDGTMPASGQLLDWLPWLGADARTMQRILVDNPAQLFDFPSA